MKQFKNIPIFIVSYNRLEDLKLLISRLEKDGYNNIIILDNSSTDKSLLEYLKGLASIYKVHFLEKNYGHMVLWECGLYNQFIKDNYYVLTDPDIIPIDECPDNYVEVFWEILEKFPKKHKVGFALKIDDIPDSYPYKWDIIRYESFYRNKITDAKYTIYDAPIDTTFALYAPSNRFAAFDDEGFTSGIRMGYPFVARHLSWYLNPCNMSDEHKLCFGGVKVPLQ